MKVVIVSTFRRGNLNIGDRLITRATVAAVERLFGNSAVVDTVFRAEKWESARKKIEGADFIIFACLAIRKNLANTYRFLPEVMRSGVPYGVLAAGTSLNVSSGSLNPVSAFTGEDVKLLQELSSGARFFTTRGALTQAACREIGIHSSSLAGDVAFIDGRFDDRVFARVDKVNRIAISDPHYAEGYRASFLHLVKRIGDVFSGANIDLLLHGVNDVAKELAGVAGIGVKEIYKDSENGLDAYDDYDLHVGYRVHGHVSALARRKFSYLLEQDGRGCDYGLTFARKISVPHYRPMKLDGEEQASVMPVDALISMLQVDGENGFSRFFGFETEIRKYEDNNLRVIGLISNA